MPSVLLNFPLCSSPFIYPSFWARAFHGFSWVKISSWAHLSLCATNNPFGYIELAIEVWFLASASLRKLVFSQSLKRRDAQCLSKWQNKPRHGQNSISVLEKGDSKIGKDFQGNHPCTPILSLGSEWGCRKDIRRLCTILTLALSLSIARLYISASLSSPPSLNFNFVVLLLWVSHLADICHPLVCSSTKRREQEGKNKITFKGNKHVIESQMGEMTFPCWILRNVKAVLYILDSPG